MSERGNVEGISLSRVAIIFYFLKYPVFNKQKVKQTGNPYTGETTSLSEDPNIHTPVISK